MKTNLACLTALAALGLAAADLPAQYYYPPQAYNPCPQAYPMRVAPDMCGAAFYCTNGSAWYGPSYNVYPPFPPYSGILPPLPLSPQQLQQQQQQANAAFPYNPWTRSPRDYFMWSEAQKERSTREVRPPFGR